MTDKLKPCPFCGNTAEVVYAVDDYNHPGVQCTECDAYV